MMSSKFKRLCFLCLLVVEWLIYGAGGVWAATAGSTCSAEGADSCCDKMRCECRKAEFTGVQIYRWQTWGAECSLGCTSGSCWDCTSTSYPDSCSSGVLSYCNSSHNKTTITCTYGSCNGSACSPGCVRPDDGSRVSTSFSMCLEGKPYECRPDGTWRVDNCVDGKVCTGAGVCAYPTCVSQSGVCITSKQCTTYKGSVVNSSDCSGACCKASWASYACFDIVFVNLVSSVYLKMVERGRHVKGITTPGLMGVVGGQMGKLYVQQI